MNRLLPLCLFLLTISTAIGQPTGTIKGQILDHTGQGAAYATVRLQALADTTKTLLGTTCDERGQYVFERLPSGTYRIAATYMGHRSGTSRPVEVAGGAVTWADTIRLLEDRQMLTEVRVRAAKPFVEPLADRIVLNVESSPIAAGGTALDVLERAPGVVVDWQNERLSLQGRAGVLVLLDDKPTYLSISEVVNLLRNTPASSVEAIDLIARPSARYDAAGNAGVINIRLKRAKEVTRQPNNPAGAGGTTPRPVGTSGNVSLTGGYGRFPKAGAGLTLTHRTSSGWSLFGNYTVDYREQWSDIVAWRNLRMINEPTRVRNRNYRLSAGQMHTYKAGAEYVLNRQTTIGLVLNGNLTNNQARIDNDNLLYDMAGMYRSRVDFLNQSARQLNRFVANANLHHRLDSTGRSLTVDADYARVLANTRDSMRTRMPAEQDTEALLQRNTTPAWVIIRSAKADYVHPLSKQTRLEAGWKSSYVTTDNDMRFETRVNGGWQPDPQRTNRFVYDETIHAGYVNGQHDWAKWSLQAGLRAEYTRSTGRSVTLTKVVDRRYVDLFPSLFLTQKLGQNHQVRYTYSRRIDRPSYGDLNPFVYVLDRYTYREGDAFLRPQYTQSVELNYTYRNKTSVAVSYSHTRDVIAHVNEQRGEQLRVGPANLNGLRTYNLTLSFPYPLTNWWSTQTNLSVFSNQYAAVIQNEPVTDWGVAANLSMSHSFVLPKGFTAEVSGYYHSPYIDGITHGLSDGQVSVGVQKLLWNKRGTVRLNATDIFFSSRFGGRIRHGQTNLEWLSNRESRTVRLAFSYNLGNTKLKSPTPRRTSADDEQRRVGS